MSEQIRARSILYGLALGDSLGWPIEFIKMNKIEVLYGTDGIQEPPDPAEYTDETQTSLAVCEALIQAGEAELDEFMEVLVYHLIKWSNSPENTRAPGHTVTESIRTLEAGVSWRKSGSQALGNGSVIRVAPIGYFYQRSPDHLRRVSTANSTATHAHPAAEQSCVAHAYLIKLALDGAPLDRYVDLTLEFLGNPTDELTESLNRVKEVLPWPDSPGLLTNLGDGWLAHEAISMALFCALRHPEDFVSAVRLAANIPGDSDSVASITGGLIAARSGVEALPADWLQRLENLSHIKDTADRLAAKKERTFGVR